ncbi:hypothetical protein J31TS4_40650 [Paenibacillus sp. J31TS4]|nr:hypothetical protein J31TS4_40650 [Paenibacillus sp. J31TS4]
MNATRMDQTSPEGNRKRNMGKAAALYQGLDILTGVGPAFNVQGFEAWASQNVDSRHHRSL